MTFIRFWIGLNSFTMFWDLLDRFGITGSYYGFKAQEILLEVIVIPLLLVGWSLFEKKSRHGKTLLRTLSFFRIFMILANASIFLGFIDAFFPAGLIWARLLQLPLPFFWLSCLLVLVLEISFFIKVSKTGKL